MVKFESEVIKLRNASLMLALKFSSVEKLYTLGKIFDCKIPFDENFMGKFVIGANFSQREILHCQQLPPVL